MLRVKNIFTVCLIYIVYFIIISAGEIEEKTVEFFSGFKITYVCLHGTDFYEKFTRRKILKNHENWCNWKKA